MLDTVFETHAVESKMNDRAATRRSDYYNILWILASSGIWSPFSDLIRSIWEGLINASQHEISQSSRHLQTYNRFVELERVRKEKEAKARKLAMTPNRAPIENPGIMRAEDGTVKRITRNSSRKPAVDNSRIVYGHLFLKHEKTRSRITRKMFVGSFDPSDRPGAAARWDDVDISNSAILEEYTRRVHTPSVSSLSSP
jgi:hypothetical protein